MTYFNVKPKMLVLLQMVGATEQIFTAEQIVNLLGKYIEKKKLYDPNNKRIIHCKNDLLGEVFQLDEFIVGDFKSLWKCVAPNLFLISKKDEAMKDQDRPKDSGECSSSETELPWWYFVKQKKKSDDADISQTTGQRSYDFRDTIEVCDTEYEDSEPEFFEEYEPVSNDDSDAIEPVPSDDENAISSDVEILQQTLSSDDSVSGDDTSTTGADFGIDWGIGLDEEWRCHECGTKNMPTVSYCMRCYKLRKGWASNQQPLTRSITEPMTSREKKIELCKSSSNDVTDGIDSKADAACSSSSITPVLPSFSGVAKRKQEEPGEVDAKKMKLDDDSSGAVSSRTQASTLISSTSTLTSTSTSTSVNDDGPNVCMICQNGLCNICRSNRNDGVIIHNRTAHQFCCYRCARRLKKKGKPCPVCRQPIAAVCRNFFVQL